MSVMRRRTRRALLRAPLLAAIGAAAMACPGPAAAASCPNTPSSKPLWIDFANGSVKFRDVFSRPGVVLATSGHAIPRAFRSAGAGTWYFEINLPNLVGRPSAPASPSTIAQAAQNELTEAKTSSGCQSPPIALNELLSPEHPGPFTGAEKTYRDNVLELMSRLRDGGALPYLLVPGGFSVSPNGAASFWRQAAQKGYLVPQIYPAAPTIYRQGPIVGNRTLRIFYRNAVTSLAALGISFDRLGLYVGYQSGAGLGGREGLKPLSSWLRVAKWQTLAARAVGREVGLPTLWSWGWGTSNPSQADPDKPTTACVFLWVRRHSLCSDALQKAGPDFNASLSEGQLKVARHMQCTWTGGGRIRAGDVLRMAAVTGGRPRALTALLETALAARLAGAGKKSVKAAEARIIRKRFGGSKSQYLKALSARGLTRKLARAVIADGLARQLLTPKPGAKPPRQS